MLQCFSGEAIINLTTEMESDRSLIGRVLGTKNITDCQQGQEQMLVGGDISFKQLAIASAGNSTAINLRSEVLVTVKAEILVRSVVLIS